MQTTFHCARRECQKAAEPVLSRSPEQSEGEAKDGVVGVRVFAARVCSVYSVTEKPGADDQDSSARAVSDGVPRIEHGALSTHKTQG